MIRRLSTVFAFLILVASVSAGDWPQFRGPNTSGASDEKNLPVKWSATDNIRWKAEIPGRGVGGPVVASGRVYTTSASGFEEKRLHLLCFDIANGKQLWHRQLSATGNTLCHPKTSMSAPTPATDGKNVYAFFGSGDLVAFDRDGNLLWCRSLMKEHPTLANNVGMAASPVVAEDTLLMVLQNAGESFALGIDKQTGKNRWKVERKSGINWTTPVLRQTAGSTEVLLQSGSDLTAYDVRSGEKRWSFDDKLGDIPSPAFGDNIVLTNGGEMAAIKIGDSAASKPEVVWKAPKLKSAGYPSPVFYRGNFYNVNSAGVVTCVAAKDGSVVWQSARVKGPFAASPLAADGKLYLLNEKGETFVLGLGEKPELLASNDLAEPALGTPAIADGAVFIRTEKGLFCVGEKK
jgi:outer membrane protein assembly factor BamB